MEIKVKIKSSSGGNYFVSVIQSEGKISLFCDCQAGSLLQMCKHKACILENSNKLLFDEDQKEAFNKAVAICQGSEVLEAYEELNSALKEVEKEEFVLKKLRKGLKAEFARKLAKGFPLN